MNAKLVCYMFGRRVRQLRREQSLSQEEFGARVGIDHNTLSCIERGTRNTRLTTIQQIASGLGVPIAALFHDDAE